MEARLHRARQLRRPVVGVCLLSLAFAGATKSFAHDEWFRGLDLEPALVEASVVLVGRVVRVSQTNIAVGGKGERSLLQFEFEPVLALKGVYSRESLSLTSDDLGAWRFPDSAPIKPGELRLLMLGRSSQGYAIRRPSSSLEQAVPPLRDLNDGLIEAIKVLLAVNATPDRPRSVTLLLNGLKTLKSPAAIPLLAGLERRSLLTAQTPGIMEAVAPHLSDPSPAVREQAARTVYSVLEADYLDQPKLREGAVNTLAASLEKTDLNFAPRVAAFEALGIAGPRALESKSVKALFAPDPLRTFAEQGARLRAMGDLQMSDQQGGLLRLFQQVPLDSPPEMQYGVEWALTRSVPTEGVRLVRLRVTNKYESGLPVVTEISLLGNLPPGDAAPALLEASKLPLDHAERFAFVSSCKKVADAQLVAPLSAMLAPSEPDVRWTAVEALVKIDTDEAAKALQPHLREETDLLRKLEIAEFLGRHGIRDGYPYAIEHMSEPYLREQAISALAAIRDPRAGGELRKILETSNDVAWNSAAIRGLGRLGAVDLAPQFLQIEGNPGSPLAPSALIALGDLHEVKAMEIARAGFASRNAEMLTASARAAGNLLAVPGVSAENVRDQLATLLADPGAPQEARAAALDSLTKLDDPRLDGALVQAVRDAGLEGSDLLEKIEKLLRSRKVKLTLP